MAFDKQAAKTFSRLKTRLSNLERASAAREGAIRRLAETLGVEVDLTRRLTPEEEYALELARTSSKRLLDSEEVKAYLREAQEDDAQ